MKHRDLEKDLKSQADPVRAAGAQRYFKTGKGEYGEGDIFLGLNTASMVKTALKYQDLTLVDLHQLLGSKIHECRSSALVILKRQYLKADTSGRKKIVDFYLNNTKGINNWDLVDISAPNILGDWLLNKDRTILYNLVKSKSLWERRISIMATFAFIREGEYKDSLKLAQILLPDTHDLIHKSVGWMLREIGKRDMSVEEKFLHAHAGRMPRTMLRYAIEKFPKEKRKSYLLKKD